MASVYYKLKSEKNYASISLDDPFISVSDLKERIFELRYSSQGTDIDLHIYNAETKEEYLDEEMLIRKNTSVLVRRVPGYRRVQSVSGQSGFKWLKPRKGYVCRRCNKPGHLIWYCMTHGDPEYDFKASCNLIPNESTFEKEMASIPTTHSLGDFPPELYCVLCNEVMRDAVLTSKCCLNSFCDKCIRDNIISKSSCLCGAKDVLADDLIPNKTLRDTITRLLDSSSSSSNNSARSVSQLQDTESVRYSQSKIASPTQSGVSKDVEETLKQVETAYGEKSVDPPQSPTQQISDESLTDEVPDILETAHESAGAMEPEPHGRALPTEAELQKKVAATEVKKKKTLMPADMERRTQQYFAADSFMVPNCASNYGYDPRWTGIQPGMKGYMGSYGYGPMNMPFPCAVPNDPFMSQDPWFHMMPPQTDTASFSSMSCSARSPLMSREEEFMSGKADLKRKHDDGREPSKDRYEREGVFSDHKTSARSRISHSDQAGVPNKKRKLSSGSKPLNHTKTRGPCGPLLVQLR